MNRRQFLQAGVGAAASVALLPKLSMGAESPGGDAMKLVPGPHLFLDDYLIAQQTNITRVIRPPAKLPKPIVTAAEDKCFQPYVSVLRDPKTGRFRMYYNTPVDSSQSHIGYMESDDGIKWIRPHRELPDPGGLKISFGASAIDDGPNVSDPSRRYKIAWECGGLFIAFSPDGLNWTAASDKRVLDDIGDIVSLSWDPIRKRHLVICKVMSRPEDGYKGKTQNVSEGQRRLVGQSYSDDCVHWTPAERIIVADKEDEGITEFYSIGPVIERGGLLIGMLKVLRDDLACEPGGEVHGIGYTCLAWTRDGKTWHRERKPFIDRNPTPHSWDRAMVWGDGQIMVGDELFIYYGGYARGHKVERFKERQIGLARMPRDRYVARAAGAEGGSLRTPTVRLERSELTVNANVTGELRVAVLDESGKAIAGFDATDSEPIKGDLLSAPVKWKKPLASLRGTPVQLEFRLRDAQLFAFELAGA